MRSVLSAMKKRKYDWIPRETLAIFEEIIQTHFAPGRGSPEGDNLFMEAVGGQFTPEQRLKIWEGNGGCAGSGYDKQRRAFASEHAGTPLAERVERYMDTFEKKHGKTLGIALDSAGQTITYTFACGDCVKHCRSGAFTAPLALYYERCALGRMANLQTALGIKLKIRSVEIPSGGMSREIGRAHV